jgi:hypothetical protein
MNYYVKELTDKRAILVAEDGYTLGEFPTVMAAFATCCEECNVRPLYIERHYSYLESSPEDFDTSFLELETGLSF